MPELKKDKSLRIPGGLLQAIIKKTLFAVANDTSRPALCGVLFQMSGDGLKVVTTDGRRLALFEAMIPPVSHKSELLISPKGLNVVNRMLGGDEKEITVQFDDSYTKFSFDGTQVFARHIEGTYPDYDKVIPSGNKKVMTASVELFTAAVKRVAILSDTFTYQIKLSLRTDSLELSSQTVDIGEAKETMAASYQGDEMDIGYNASYLLDILKNLENDELNMYLNTPLSAGLIKPAKQADDYKLTYLLMPLRLPE
jgi:DNA polymerase-3 subunit beta